MERTVRDGVPGDDPTNTCRLLQVLGDSSIREAKSLKRQYEETVSIGEGADGGLTQRQRNYRTMRKEIAETIYGGISEMRSGRPGLYILRDILPAVRLRKVLELVEIVKRIDRVGEKPGHGKKAFERFVAIIWHPEQTGENEFEEEGHAHIYHSCTYNQSHCTCTFLRGLKLKRRLPRFASSIGAQQVDDWESWLEYFLTERRQILHLQVNGVSLGRNVHQLVFLRTTQRSEETEPDGTLESDGFSSKVIG